MSKVVLIFVGLALLAISGHYFVSLNLSEIYVKPTIKSKNIPASEESVLPVSRVFTADKKIPIVTANPPPKPPAPEPAPPKAPEQISAGDSLRFALEGIVEESIEQELWDEMETEPEKPKLTPQNTTEGEIYERESQ